jgi:hypothetical protein
LYQIFIYFYKKTFKKSHKSQLTTAKIYFISLIIFFFTSISAQDIKGYTVVAGSGANFDAVEKITTRVSAKGIESRTLEFSVNGKPFFRTCHGFFKTQNEAVAAKNSLIGITGISDAWVLKITAEYLHYFEGEVNNKVDEPQKKEEDIQQPETDTSAVSPHKQKDEVNIPPEKQDDLTEIIRIYSDIRSAISKNNFKTIEQYIDPELGFIEIIDPSGISFPIHYQNFEQALSQGFFITTSSKTPVPSYLPEFDCNLGVWTNQGVFISKIEKYERITRALEDAGSEIYKDELLIKTIDKLEFRISVLIVATDESILGFFKRDGKWYLGVVDNAFDCVE